MEFQTIAQREIDRAIIDPGVAFGKCANILACFQIDLDQLVRRQVGQDQVFARGRVQTIERLHFLVEGRDERIVGLVRNRGHRRRKCDHRCGKQGFDRHPESPLLNSVASTIRTWLAYS